AKPKREKSVVKSVRDLCDHVAAEPCGERWRHLLRSSEFSAPACSLASLRSNTGMDEAKERNRTTYELWVPTGLLGLRRFQSLIGIGTLGQRRAGGRPYKENGTAAALGNCVRPVGRSTSAISCRCR